MKMIICSAVLIGVLTNGVNAAGTNEQVKKEIVADEGVAFKAPHADLKCIPTQQEHLTVSRIHPLVFPHEERPFVVEHLKGNRFESPSDGLVQVKVPNDRALKVHSGEIVIRGKVLIASAVGKSISVRESCLTDNAHFEARSVKLRNTSGKDRLSITAGSIKLRETRTEKIELHCGTTHEWRLHLRDIEAQEIVIDAPANTFLIMRIRLNKWNPLPKLNFLNKEVKGIIALSGEKPEAIRAPAGIRVFRCGTLYRTNGKNAAQIYSELDKN